LIKEGAIRLKIKLRYMKNDLLIKTGSKIARRNYMMRWDQDIL
jgi:hypothetical protein